MDSNPEVENSLKRRLLLPTLLLCEFAVFSFAVFLSILLLDIAKSYNIALGTASQIGTASRFVGIFVGLAMSALALKVRTKTIFLGGIVAYVIGILGSFFAPDFVTMLVFSVITGAGSILSGVMILVVIGEQLPLKIRGWAIGLVTGATFVANVVVPQISTYVNNFIGWREVLLWFMLPTTVISFILGLLVVPSRPVQAAAGSKPEYTRAYKQILINRSAVSCIVATALFNFGLSVQLYLTSFYRISFAVSLNMAALFYSAVSIVAVFGGVVGGRLINRVGRKTLTYVPGFLCGLTTLLMVFSPNVLLSVAFWFANATTAAMAISALHSLNLEQVPEFRGSMMSVASTFRFVGLFLGPLVGGLALNISKNNFPLIFTIFGAAMMAIVPFVAFLARDPCRTPQTP